jgi:hypothetical protein
MTDFEKWWNGRSQFYKGLRTGKHDLSFDALGYRRLPATPSEPSYPQPATPVPVTLQWRSKLVALIDSGVRLHSGRLNVDYWQRASAWLNGLDPATPGITGHLDDLIPQWRDFAIEAGQSRGVWDLMSAASFKTWSEELIAVTQHYRDACAALQSH